MFGLFKGGKAIQHKTHYGRERAKQDRARLESSKTRLAVVAALIEHKDTTTNRVDLALEMYDLIRYIELHTKANDFKLGVILSDCDVLRLSKHLGQNKYCIETTDLGW